MSLSSAELFLDRDSLPSVEAVTERVSAAGYDMAFPAGFSLSDADHSFWLPLTLNGFQTGFDYFVLPHGANEKGSEDSADLPQSGDTRLSFVARGDHTSVLAAALVQRAICELTDAQGWWQEGEEAMSNADMIAFCTGTIAAAENSLAQPLHSATATPRRQSRIPEGYWQGVGKAVLLCVAVFAGIPLFFKILKLFVG